METIIFNFVSADITNGSTQTTDITINLQSDDNPEVSSIVVTGDGSFDEGTATTVTMSIPSASSTNVTLPVTISGTATEGTDYTTAFPSLGTAELVLTQSDNYGDMNIHSDGRLFFIRDYTLRVHTPSTGATTEHTLTNYYGDYDFVLSGNIIYARTNVNGVINKIDITDLSAITETTIVPEATDDHENSFSFADGVLYYNYYNYSDSNLRQFYTKTGEADPVLLYTGNEISAKTLLYNGRLLLVDNCRMYELVDGVYTEIDNSYSNDFCINQNNTKVYNGKIYTTANVGGSNNLLEITLPAGGGAGEVTLETITIDNTTSFNNYVFSGATLLKTSYESGSYVTNSYQLTPQIQILAGETTGTITFTSIDDTINEANETIIVTPGTAVNATNSQAAVTAIITDNDAEPVVTFALSATTIVENTSGSATLTATSSVASEQDITIPLTLSGTALASEYTVSAESITITAGSTTGSVTITATEDDSDVEVMETIIFTYGTLVNGTTEATDITLNLQSDDNPTVSSIVAAGDGSLLEGDEGATGSLVTYTQVNNGDFTETYTAPAGEAASVTINGTTETNYDFIYVYNGAGTLLNTDQNDGVFTDATYTSTDGTITVNITSDSSNVQGDITLVFGTVSSTMTTTVTMTIDSPSSTNVTLPVTISGTATEGTDYLTSFPSSGQASTVLTQSDNYGDMNIHSDGRLFFIRDYKLRVHTPSTGATTEHTLTNYYGDYDFVLSGNIIYARTNVGGVINKIDITDLSAITETTFVPESPTSTTKNLSFADGVLFYTYYNNSGQREYWTKTGDADPVLLHSGNEMAGKALLFNGRYLLIDDNRMSELVDGIYTVIDNNFNPFPNISTSIDRNNTKVYNGKIYSTVNYSSGVYYLTEVILPAGGGAGDVTFETITIENTASFHNYVFSGATLLKTSNESGVYTTSSYQLTPEIVVLAGETEGTITFTSIDDYIDEANETIIVTPGTAVNATSTEAAVTVTIIDNDDPVSVSMSLSALDVTEGANSVALTATIAAQAISAQDITVPFTLAGTALAGQYTVTDANGNTTNEVTITPGESSGSVNITAVDDDTIEGIETILFNFVAADFTNALLASQSQGSDTSLETLELSLNLVSDDDPAAMITATSNDISEEGTTSTSLTLTIDNPSSYDLTVPLILSGEAVFNIDYTTDFGTEGTESVTMAPMSNKLDSDFYQS